MVIARSTRRQSLLLLAAATAAIPAAAQERTPELRGEAQGTPSAGATRPVRLAIDGLTPGLQVRVEPRSERVPEGAAKAAVCAEDCELELQKGTYTLIASRGDEHRTKEVELTSSQLLRVGQWDGVARTTGIVMGITGLIVGAIGAFITVGSFVAPSPGPDDEDLDNTGTKVLFAGMAGLAAGTGLAIGGFSLAAGNRAPSMDLERMPTSRPPAPGAGAGISLGGKF
jgi:hypothetical protein